MPAPIGLALLLALLWVAARVGGAAFAKLRQPRVVGEILGGALLGPTVLGWVSAGLSDGLSPPGGLAPAGGAVLDLVYEAGLLLLMFLSGARMKGLLGKDDRRAVAWLASVGTALPFVIAVLAAPALPLDRLSGPASSPLALILVLGTAAAVTSIPVISRIFHDLGVLETRFARLVLGVAVVEDVALWAVLALATTLAASAALEWGALAWHLTTSVAYLVLALGLAPPLVRALERRPGNPLVGRAPVAWLALVACLYALAAWGCGVSVVFAAFFAGVALDAGDAGIRARLDRIERVAYAVPIPIYFALVGYRLDFGRGFDPVLVALLIAGACALKLASVGLGARLAGFRGRALVNLAVATNARGGPGIVLATVAFDAGIVNPLGYTALVLLAVVSSQAAGAWLERALRRGPLLLVDVELAPPAAEDAAPGGAHRSHTTRP